MKKKLLLCLFALAAFCCAAVPSFAQITLEERDIIIEEIMKRLNIEEIVDKAIEARMPDIDLKVTEAMDAKYSNIKNEIREEVSENLKTDLLNGDIVLPYQSAAQEAPAEKKQDAQEKQSTQAIQETQEKSQEPKAESAAQEEEKKAEPTPVPQKTENKKTYNGPHVKFVNAYAYVNGGSSDSGHTFKSEYYPNELFTVDVVFENDGNAPLPPNLELRHTGNIGEYTGHTESAFSYGKIVKPGERIGFSFAAHGSENIGNITFFFQLMDADSGGAISDGAASFFYVARP